MHPRFSLTAALTLGAVAWASSEPRPQLVTVYASCDGSPRLDGAPRRPLVVTVGPAPGARVTVVQVKLRDGKVVQRPGTQALDEAGWRGEFGPALCDATQLSVEVLVREVKAKTAHRLKLPVLVQRLN